MAWSVSGRSLELCSCRLLCPCWLSPDVEPDQGWCSGAFVFDVGEGNSEGIDLAGCKVAAGFEWPGNFWKGEGTARRTERARCPRHSELSPPLAARECRRAWGWRPQPLAPGERARQA